jgi:diguanylate cyclase (GGDEF)-like protein/PAS domain S-box-containing protein
MINLLTPPIFEDEGKTLLAHHIFIIIWTCMAVGWLALLIAIIIPGTVYRWLLVVGIIESAGLILLALNKNRHTRLVSNLLIFIVWAVATGMALTGGGTSSNAMAIYFIVVLIAGLMLSGKAGIVTAGLCSLTGLFLVYLEYSGALPVNQVPHTPLTRWIASTIYMAIIISLQFLVSRTIRNALKQSRRELKERRWAEIALRMANNDLDNIINCIGYPVFVKDDSFRFTHVNDALCDILGIERKEIIGKTLGESLPKDQMDHFLEVDSMVLESGVENQCEELLTGRDGRILNIVTKKMRYVDEQGNRFLVGVIHDITERKRIGEALQNSENKYRELSVVDELTQLYNSRHFYHQLKMEIDRAERYRQPLTLLLFDLDNFKAFNDVYGHVEGDQVLRQLGQVVKRCLRETDFAYRYGGEEFTIILPMTTSADGAVTAERIRAEFKKEPFSPLPGQDIHLTVSIGLGQYKPQEEMKAFVHRVDQLMYQGKKNGKDRVCCES